jgi:hypothetical protein
MAKTLQDNQQSSHVQSPSRATGSSVEVVIAESDLALLIDDSGTEFTYIGYAAAGSLSSAAVWKIKRIDESDGLVIKWADGNTSFDNIWDNRASLTYI